MFDVAWIHEHKYLLVNLSHFHLSKVYFLVDIANLNFRKFNYSHLVVANDLFDYLSASGDSC